MFDTSLYILWSLRQTPLSIHEISLLMRLSEKQVIRKIRKWELEGWISYSPGKGRGNLSSIKWLKDVEESLLQSLQEAFKQKSFLLLNNLNMNYFSDSFQQQVVDLLVRHMSTVEQSGLPTIKFPIYISTPSLHPQLVNDTESAWILSHIYSRIVLQNEKSEFEGDLVHHWDKFESRFIFYLRPRLFWHDGNEVKMEEIIDALNSSFQLPKYLYFTRKFVCIEKVSNQAFCIEYKGSERELLMLLSQIDFSLYHPEKSFIGTGPYKIENRADGIIQIIAHTKYHLAQSYIDSVEFVTIPSILQRKIVFSMQQTHQLQRYKELSGLVYAYLNPYSDKLHNQQIRSYVLHILKLFAIEIEQVDALKVSLIHEHVKLNQQLILPRIKIGYIVNQTKFVDALRSICQQYALEVEIIHYHVSREFTIRTSFEQVDILIMGEFPDKNELLPIKIYDTEHPFSIISEQQNPETWHCLLYESYREIFYPVRFRRSLTSFYGYPDLARSWICEY